MQQQHHLHIWGMHQPDRMQQQNVLLQAATQTARSPDTLLLRGIVALDRAGRLGGCKLTAAELHCQQAILFEMLPCRMDKNRHLRAEHGVSKTWCDKQTDPSPFLPEEPSPLTLSLLPLSTPGGTFRLIFLVRRTRPSPPQVLQGVAFSPAPSQSGHVDICKQFGGLRDQPRHVGATLHGRILKAT